MSQQDSTILPSVTVIFLTYNGRPLVSDVLQALRKQDYSATTEILCIDSSSTDGTKELCQQFCDRVIQIQPADFHHSRTRNLGVKEAQGDICVFLSQDALPAGQSWLRNLVTPFVDSRVAAVYGRQEAPRDFGAQRRYSLSQIYPTVREVREFEPGKTRLLSQIRFSNANGAYRRQLLIDYPFPEHIPLSEDAAVCYQLLKAGHQVIYEPTAHVIHGHERSLREEFGWSVDVGISLKRCGILGNPVFDSETKYGMKKVLDEVWHFSRTGSIHHAARGFAIYVARWLGVQFGKRESQMPASLLRRISPTLKREYERSRKDVA